ncbi:MAG: ABC transporter ATP-binding protein [Candidatus Omnitrophica bacterium]|nr:ABC transporter ATP-binding protein [Candidatus Omnitrophota bacterium]
MLEARNIHKFYNHKSERLHVLKGVELKIEKGKFVAVLGPSGAGKTTLLQLLGGLDHPSKGEVFIEGQDIYSLSDNRRAELRNTKIGFVFQFYHLLSEFNVIENAIIPALIRGKNNKDSLKLARELLELVGLAMRIKHFPNELSGGEKQRLAIIRALINNPDLLFCDEPTGNLDSLSGNEIINLIKDLNQKRKMTVVLVTHNRDIASSADKLFYLNDGKLEESHS